MNDLRNRFPGAKPFTVEDKEVFYGREKDIDKLYELLKIKRMIVLYAQSGLGKSSLVNAGLIPKFNYSATGNKFAAVKIRFGLSQFTGDNKAEPEILLTKIIDELKENEALLKRKDFPFADDLIENSLWYQAKLFERNGIHLLLVFDQFEEAFTFNPDQITAFKEQIFSVFSGIPKKLNDLISNEIKLIEEKAIEQQQLVRLEEDLKFIYAPLNTQLLFVIREDKLGFFNSFTDYFPDIMKDTFKLLPLSKPSAVEAITLPAGKKGNFKTKPFTFSPTALEQLLDHLSEKNGTYDPFTIQLTCRYIEKTLIDKEGKCEIKEGDIPEVGIIVKDFIESAWKALPGISKKKVELCKEIIEKKLIAHDIEKRISVHEGDWLDDKVVTVLINEGLFKRDRRGGVDYIELSHDRLIKPLLEDYKLRKQLEKLHIQQKKNKLITASIALIIFSFIAVFIYNDRIHHAEEEASLVSQKEEIEVNKNMIINLEDSIQKVVISNDSAETYTNIAEDLVGEKKYKEADRYFKLAISKAIKGDDSKTNTIIKLRNELIPNLIRNESEAISIYKIDVFYDERTIPQSKETADFIINKLNKNKDFIVRKKVLTAARINRNSTWNIQSNLIRHEKSKDEKLLADSLIKNFNSSDFILNSNKLFTGEQVRSGFKTPYYISIFIHK